MGPIPIGGGGAAGGRGRQRRLVVLRLRELDGGAERVGVEALLASMRGVGMLAPLSLHGDGGGDGQGGLPWLDVRRGSRVCAVRQCRLHTKVVYTHILYKQVAPPLRAALQWLVYLGTGCDEARDTVTYVRIHVCEPSTHQSYPSHHHPSNLNHTTHHHKTQRPRPPPPRARHPLRRARGAPRRRQQRQQHPHRRTSRLRRCCLRPIHRARRQPHRPRRRCRPAVGSGGAGAPPAMPAAGDRAPLCDIGPR